MMTNMLEQMMVAVVKKVIKTDLAHIQLPSNMYAQVTKREDKGSYFEYNLKILDKNKNINTDFPEIPKVKYIPKQDIGDIMVVMIINGILDIYIVGEVVE